MCIDRHSWDNGKTVRKDRKMECLEVVMKSMEILEKVMPLFNELETQEGFGCVICTVIDQWCANHDVDAEEFRKQMGEIMQAVHEDLGPLQKQEV